MIVGVSGHQNLGAPDVVAWIEQTIRDELLHHPASTGISCLAAGTDQIFAKVILGLGWSMEVVIPCTNYDSAFGDVESREKFEELNQFAARRHILDFPKPSENAFLSAGLRVVDMSDMMLFVWNGKPARGLGGTADIVKYAKKLEIPFVYINPITRLIERIGFATQDA